MTKSKTNTPKKLGDRIYGGMASFGRFTSTLWAIIISLIGILFFYFGIKWIQMSYEKVDAKVIDVKCVPKTCNINVSYTYKGKEENRFLDTGSSSISKGSTITVYIDSENQVTINNPKTTSMIMIIAGVFLILLAWFVYWINQTYEFAAAGTGVGNVFNMWGWNWNE